MLPTSDVSLWFNLSVALGVGLLVGAERERRNGATEHRRAAGIRTFALSALAGGVAIALDQPFVFLVVLLAVGALALAAYWRQVEHEPGLTSEIALIITCLLGALSVTRPAMAAGIGVVLVALLAGREQMHRFVRRALTEAELHDLILFLGMALIALPLAPDRYVGPFDAINPHALVRFVVMVMAVGAMGHVGRRLLGAQYGLAVSGLAGGFVSSTATIYSMAQLSARDTLQLRGAAAGAVLSTVATMVQLSLVLWLLLPPLFWMLVWPLALGGAAAALYALGLLLSSRMQATAAPGDLAQGHAFELKTTLSLAAFVLLVTLVAAALNAWVGAGSLVYSAAATGLVDAHSIVASVSALVGSGKVMLADTPWAVFAALSSNTLTKAVIVCYSGTPAFRWRVLPGLVLLMAAVWLAALATLP
jgi:uncharacterized membrane protein (DUF4010 family)